MTLFENDTFQYKHTFCAINYCQLILFKKNHSNFSKIYGNSIKLQLIDNKNNYLLALSVSGFTMDESLFIVVKVSD